MSIVQFGYENMTAAVPAIWHYATGVISLICLLYGLLMNGLVIFVFIRSPNLRRPRNFFIINLAITDLGLLLTNNTLHVIASMNKHWPFGQAGCNFYALTGGICGLTSIATMVSISLTRLMAVINPFSSLKLSGHFTLRCIACSWIYGSMWIILPLFGWNRFIFEGFGTTCTFDYISQGIWDRIFILILVVGGFLLPLSIILISYTIILRKLSERGRYLMYSNINNQNHGFKSKEINVYYFHSTISANDDKSQITITDLNEGNPIKQNIRRTEVRAARTALCAIAIFCIAWGPYALLVGLSQFGFNHLINAYSTAILGLLTKTAACINPVIYAFSSATFQKEIYRHIKFLYTVRSHDLVTT